MALNTAIQEKMKTTAVTSHEITILSIKYRNTSQLLIIIKVNKHRVYYDFKAYFKTPLLYFKFLSREGMS